jgi:hypothetical protein
MDFEVKGRMFRSMRLCPMMQLGDLQEHLTQKKSINLLIARDGKIILQDK